MRLISVDNLQQDHMLAFPVFCKGALVINTGRDNMMKYIPNFKNMGIQFVYIEDGLSEGIKIPDAISEKTRFECKKILKNTIQESVSKSDIKLYDLSNSVNSVINEIIQNKEVLVSLNDIGTLDEHAYIHSVNVSVYSLLIGRGLNYSKAQLKDLAMGTMLHDIGKTLIEPIIQFKEGRLSDQEFEQMKKHTEIGYYILSKNPSIPENVRQIALNHHEKLDGSGYPKGKKADEISEFDKIACIADVYDALTSDRTYKKKWKTEKAVDFLIENSGTMFSPELVQIFIQQIAIYPNGSMVELSDGTIGIIKDQNRHVPMRPIVRVIYDALGQEIRPYEVNLMEILCLTIVDSQLEIVNQLQKDDGISLL